MRYAQYEMNLDNLRRKRVKRLGVRSTGFSGQRRIFFVLDRATRKFPGDIGLWVQYIEYARQQKSYKKLSMILTDALRLNPTNVDLWLYAAQYSLDEHADMTQSRSYMQRGLRFCKSSRKLWLHYAKLELIYIAKLFARQRILGLDREIEAPKADQGPSLDDPDADMIAMPQITEEDINPTAGGTDEANQQALQTLSATPALTGAIPLAIFNTAMKHFENDDRFGHEFYDMTLEFEDLPCLRRILEEVVETMRATKLASPHTQICYIRLPTAGIRVTSADFPRALGASLGRFKESQNDPRVAKEVIGWLQPIAQTENLDPALQTVLSITIQNAERVLATA